MSTHPTADLIFLWEMNKSNTSSLQLVNQLNEILEEWLKIILALASWLRISACNITFHANLFQFLLNNINPYGPFCVISLWKKEMEHKHLEMRRQK